VIFLDSKVFREFLLDL